MNVIRTELSEFSAHYLKKTVTFDFVYILSSAYIDQSAPNLGKIFMSNRIWMSWVMGLIEPEQLELFSLELWKIAAFDFVYSLTSTDINRSAPNLITMNMSIRSRMSLIMGQVIPDQLVLSVFEVEKLNFSSLFGIYLHYQPVLLSTQVGDIGPSWSSCLRFPQYFLPIPKQISIFQSQLFCCLHYASIWTSLKYCRLVKS